MKSTLSATLALTMLLAVAPSVARATNECGTVDISQNPNVASCVGDPHDYVNGITYDASTLATPASLKIDVYGTAVVAPSANTNGVTILGAQNFDALGSKPNQPIEQQSQIMIHGDLGPIFGGSRS